MLIAVKTRRCNHNVKKKMEKLGNEQQVIKTHEIVGVIIG